MTHFSLASTLRAASGARKAVSSLALGSLLCALSAPALAQSGSNQRESRADAPLHAASEPMQILAVRSDDAVDDAQAITSSLKNAAQRRAEVELLTGDYSLEVLSLTLGCRDTPDRACLDRIANKTRCAAFIWGDLKHADRELSLSLHLYRRAEPDRSTEIRYDPETDSEGLAAVADRALTRLLATGERSPSSARAESTGTLLLDAGDLEGWVAVDGARAGVLHDGHAELKLPIGERAVTVHASGYQDARGTIEISVDGPVVLHLHAQKIRPLPASPAADGAPPRVEDDQPNKAAALTALVVGGAFLGAGFYSTVRVDRVNRGAEFDGYRAGVPEDQDSCVAADRGLVVPGRASPTRISALCTQGKTFEALQYVFFGLGAVAAGTGVLILLTGDESRSAHSDAGRRRRQARLKPSFSVSPRSAAVSLGWQY